MKYLIGLFIFLANVSVFAEVASQTSLELRMQEKISSLVRPIDENAIVLTNVKFRKVDTNLPGMGGSLHEVFTPERSDQGAVEDIETVSVRIISRLTPFPPALRKLIESSLGVQRTRIKFSFEKMDDSLEKIIQDKKRDDTRVWAEPLAQKFLNLLTETGQAIVFMFKVFAGSFLAIMGIFYLLTARRHRSSQSFWDQGMQRLNDSLSKGLEGGGERAALPLPVEAREVSSSQTSNHEGNHYREQLQELSGDSLRALLSDCYWCEKDDYAAWMWSSMTAAQREDLLRSWPTSLEYSSYLGRISPNIQYDHLNSCYLRPIDLSAVSQSDLTDWIRKNTSAWSLISPLRQANLKLTLQEKMTLAVQKGPSIVPPVPNASTTLRVLSTSVEVGTLSELDELSILENPAFVPAELRPQVWSLVWLALLPTEQRTNILDEISAQNLAEAWIGPVTLLEKIEAVLPEKKKKLLQGYLKSAKPSRRSGTMKYLTSRALQAQNEIDHPYAEATLDAEAL